MPRQFDAVNVSGVMSIMDEDKRVTEGRVGCAEYGMHYSPANEKVVERARSLPDEDWDTLPIQQLPNGTPLEANEEMLKKEPIEKVVSGAEPFREGYVTKLWRAEDGKLHIADGHHRVAMYSVLGRDMPVRILDEAAYNRLTERKGPPR